MAWGSFSASQKQARGNKMILLANICHDKVENAPLKVWGTY